MTAIKFDIPVTRDQGPCKIIGTESHSETAEENALWHYNRMREHDGQPPLSRLPEGTKATRVED